MAGIGDFASNPMQDELLRISGSTNNAQETITLAQSPKTSTPVFYGENRLCGFALLVAGAVTGTSPTLDTTIEACSDAAGTGAATVGTFPQQTATQLTDATEDEIDPPRIMVRTPTGKPYLRAKHVVTGTGAQFVGVTIMQQPVSVGAP